MPSFSRRRFLQLSTFAALSAPRISAIEPFARKGQPRLQLSLAAYSFRESFKDVDKGTPKADAKLDMFGFIDYCAEQGCDGAELTSYYFPKNVSTEQLLQIRRHAFLRGVTISGTSVGNNFARAKGAELDREIADVKKWIDRAAILGAPHIRVFAGAPAKDLAVDEAKQNCLAALEECCSYAGQRGIFLGLENHGGLVTEPDALLEIVKTIKSPWFGINLDTGNFNTADPYADLARCAPYAVNVQVKVDIKRAGAKTNEPADLGRLIDILGKANYQGWVALEYESADPAKGVPEALNKLKALMRPRGTNDNAMALFDGQTLAGWKITDFATRGNVEAKGGTIVLGQGDPLTGITWVGEPPARTNYEISLEAMKQTGDDFFCALTAPSGKDSFTLVVGGWGGGLVGISSIDGMDASENSTTQFRKFDKDRWYRIRLRVTPKKFEAWIDDDQLVDEEIEGKKISMRLGEIEMCEPLGIASFRTQAVLRNITFRKL